MIAVDSTVTLAPVICPRCKKATNVAAPKGTTVAIFKCRNGRCGFTGTVTV